MVECDCIDRLLSVSFRKLGHFIGQYPGYFIIVPVLIAGILVTGLQRLHYEDDPEYLFSPTEGRSKFERSVIDNLFPINYTRNFNPGRITHKGRFGRVIVVPNDRGNVLRRSIWSEIVLLDQLIKNVTIDWDDSPWKYEDLCARSEGKCWNNDILDFEGRIGEIEDKKFFLRYPIWINQEIYKPYLFPVYLGGVRSDANGLVESAQAINLMYFLDTTVKHGDVRGALWEQAFMKLLSSRTFANITVARFISTTLQTELEANTHSLVPFFSITVIIMLIFSVGTCMMSDWVLSKPWLGLLGCVSAGIAVAASFGLAVYCGVDMIGINLAAPFLMLGVGMDDAFVLLAAWRRTSPRMSVAERLGHTYSEAAVSITITSVTNFISFLIGTITPFPSVRIFCIYTSLAVLFTYIYHVTFFGGIMALFGHAERRNLHGLVCVPVMPKSLAENKSLFFRLLCTGGRNPADPNNPKDNKEHTMMIFFRDTIGASLSKTYFKALVLFGFMIYLAIGIWGCTMVKEGLDRRKLSRDDSYSILFYDYEDRFFREYPYRIQVVINKTLNYADTEVQNRIEEMLQTFERSKFVADGLLTESWLRAYQKFYTSEDSFLFLQALNVSNEEDFNRGLKDIFLHFPMTEPFRNDIAFSDNASEIIGSRFIVQTVNITDANMEKAMLIELREIADKFAVDLQVTVFHQYFIFFDQFVLVRAISIQTITMAAIVMMIISLIFIPSLSCAFWVAFSIISIEIGVIGYMTHWGVNLDSISMINLIMCIGFSVDFSAHISYAYISCYEDDPNEKVKTALYSLGLPIFQGSVSTVLGIIALAFAPSYVFVTFFKTVFLVMLFGATHGVLLLPVLLSMTDFCQTKKKRSDKRRYKSNIEANDRPNPFLTGDKHFTGQAILHNGQAICIPRPSFTDLPANGQRIDEDSGAASKSSTASSDGSMIGPTDKDLGIGTSAEECSEGSWKDTGNNPNQLVLKQSDVPRKSMSSVYETIYKDWSRISQSRRQQQQQNKSDEQLTTVTTGQLNPAFVGDSPDDYFEMRRQSGSSLIRSTNNLHSRLLSYHHSNDINSRQSSSRHQQPSGHRRSSSTDVRHSSSSGWSDIRPGPSSSRMNLNIDKMKNQEIVSAKPIHRQNHHPR